MTETNQQKLERLAAEWKVGDGPSKMKLLKAIAETFQNGDRTAVQELRLDGLVLCCHPEGFIVDKSFGADEIYDNLNLFVMTWPTPPDESQSGFWELWGADPWCVHEERIRHGGGVGCTKCGGWFCY
ncbi:hypothetical protein FDI24_gp036 [Acidovorax phage ACP17]|uniref:Uncharacterized protein n=1 Tax=Acidovorax phage ACP17 TaxID=2010329 RepID=A0A218M3E0_9CAUD|nr:hypothetical protein FDI24_gp036 [Acidovorax phage ACP17]ASD50570.1 hypothetical protein [Acidovorax phage ACP17]